MSVRIWRRSRSATAVRCGLANDMKLRMVSLRRSDSRRTMSINCDWSGVSGSSSRRIWMEPAIDARGIADFMGDAGGHLADRGETLLHARLAIALLQLGDVLEGEQEAALRRAA